MAQVLPFPKHRLELQSVSCTTGVQTKEPIAVLSEGSPHMISSRVPRGLESPKSQESSDKSLNSSWRRYSRKMVLVLPRRCYLLT